MRIEYFENLRLDYLRENPPLNLKTLDVFTLTQGTISN